MTPDVQRAPRAAYVILVAACFAYLAAVMQRSSLGVASVEATDRFHVAATVLSVLGVAQIVVYAALQVPVGVMIDRFGPRALLVVGAGIMAAGQVIVAVSADIATATAGRMLVGAGDAMTFTSGIRLLAMWFPPNRAPIITQIFGQVGQVGQLLSAFPFLALLHGPGWLAAWLSAAALAILGGLAVFVATASAGRPPHPFPPQSMGLRDAVAHVAEALRRPGTQLGFWTHYTLQPSMNVFVLLWGFPFLNVAVGLSAELSTTLIALPVLVGGIAGPLLGILSARFPFRRSALSLAIVAVMLGMWLVVLAWPGTPPVWLLVALIVVLAVGGPGSLIGFDYARTYNPARQIGSATGIVNVGGFLATFLIMFAVGVVLDLLRDPTASDPSAALYTLDGFRIAFLVQFPVIGLGVVMILLTRARVRRDVHAVDGVQVAPLWVAVARRLRRRDGRGGGSDHEAVE